jgi:putative transposase
MSTSGFSQGAIFEIDGRAHQLLRKVEGDLWQAEESRTKRIVDFRDRQLRELYVEGKLRFDVKRTGTVATAGKQPVLDYSPEQWERAKIRRAYVLAILDLPSYRPRLIPPRANVR